MPTLIIIAGPNGAGKTTFAREYLSADERRFEFVNADEIARGLRIPSDFSAARIMLTRNVKRTSVAQAFLAIGYSMIFLFDYGDGWHFRVSLKEAGTKVAKIRYPRVVTARGEAPAQYPDGDEDAPR